jgi:F0F1-type ATP synthase delta subunit
MRVRDYSTGVLELILNGMSPETALEKLRAMLSSRGHERLYPKILRELLTEASRTASRNTATVTLARKDDARALHGDIESALHTLGVTEHDIVIDETITGGFVVEAKEKRIDRSYKKSLLTLYRSLIKS